MAVPQVPQICESCSRFCSSWRDYFFFNTTAAILKLPRFLKLLNVSIGFRNKRLSVLREYPGTSAMSNFLCCCSPRGYHPQVVKWFLKRRILHCLLYLINQSVKHPLWKSWRNRRKGHHCRTSRDIEGWENLALSPNLKWGITVQLFENRRILLRYSFPYQPVAWCIPVDRVESCVNVQEHDLRSSECITVLEQMSENEDVRKQQARP